MKKLIGIIDKLNEKINNYLFKPLSEKEEKNFEKLLNARESIQDIIRATIDDKLKYYCGNRYETKKEVLKIKRFLKRYANIDTEIITHKHGIFEVYYTLELLFEEYEEITQDDLKDYMSSYIY